MTEFIESFATQQLLPPWVAEGAQTWGFVFALDAETVQTYLDYHFNAGFPEHGRYHYAALLGLQFAMLTVSDCPSTCRKKQVVEVGGWDHFSHQEAFLAFPARRLPINDDNMILAKDEGEDDVVWIQPFACSSSSTVVFSGREIWGADMMVASIEIQSDRPHHVHVDTTYMGPKKFSPKSVSSRLPFLHIEADGQRSDTEILKTRPEFQRFLDYLGLKDPEVSYEVNHLKQFRDIHDVTAALYRAIVSTQSKYSNRQDFCLLDETKVDISFMWSPQMNEVLEHVLGVTPAKDAPARHVPRGVVGEHDVDWGLGRVQMKAELAFSFKSDIEFEVNDTLYTYQDSYRATR